MKAFLIFLNICLAGGIFWSLLKQAETPQVNEDEYFFRASEKEKKKTPAKTETAARKKTPVSETRDADISVRKIMESNIFDPARCPGARIPGRRNSNTGLDMTLVGTFVIGEQSGAIILQKRRQNTNSAFPWMMQGGGPPIAMPAFQNNGGGSMNGGMPGSGNGAQNQNGNMMQGGGGGGFARNRFGSGEMFARWRQMQNRQQNGGNNGEEAAVVYQQYVRVGETLANGYKLTAVTRTGATLMKNSEKLELEIVEASRNAGAERSRNNNTNPSGLQNRGMFPWMMPGMMMGGGMGGMGGGRGGFPFNNNNFMQQNGGGNQQQNSGGNARGSRQGRSRGQ